MKSLDGAADGVSRRSVRSVPERNRGGGITVLILLVVIALGAVAAWPSVAPRLSSIFSRGPGRASAVDADLGRGAMSVEDRLEALEASIPPVALRLDIMERRLGQLEAQSRQGNGNQAGSDMVQNPQAAQFASDIDKLRHDLDILRNAGSDVAIAGRLSSAMEKTEAAVRRLAGRRDHTALAVLAMGQLREAVDRGQPFAAQLQAVAQVAGGRTKAALAGLDAYSRTGVPTRVAILGQFPSVSLAASRVVIDGGESWWEGRLLMALNSVVTIRRNAGGDNGAVIVLSQAGRLVDSGDLSGAVAVLRLLPTPFAEVFAPWVASATARLAVDGAVSDGASAAIAESVTADE